MLRALLLICCVFMIVLCIRALAQGRQQSPVDKPCSWAEGVGEFGAAAALSLRLRDPRRVHGGISLQQDADPRDRSVPVGCNIRPPGFCAVRRTSPLATDPSTAVDRGRDVLPRCRLFIVGADGLPVLGRGIREPARSGAPSRPVLDGDSRQLGADRPGNGDDAVFGRPMLLHRIRVRHGVALRRSERLSGRLSSRHMLSSTLAKEFLWQAYTGQSSLPGGISAMPSMHNAQVALFVAFAYSLNRRFGHVMLVYAALDLRRIDPPWMALCGRRHRRRCRRARGVVVLRHRSVAARR